MADNKNENLSAKALKEKLQIQKEINEALGFEVSFKQKSSLLDNEMKIVKQQLLNLEEDLNNAVSHKNQFSKKTIKGIKDQIIEAQKYKKSLEDQLKVMRKQQDAVRKQEELLRKQKQAWDNIAKSVGNLAETISGSLWKYLMESDKAIKGITLQLGLSGNNAERLRDNMTGAAMYAAKLGASMDDLAKIQSEYADEVSRTMSLTEQQFKLITNIGKGTGLGVEQAGKLAGQFDLVGANVKRTEEYVQGVVDSSERLGINATKVLKNISKNFKTLNTFSFKGGIKGMARMSEYSETFKINMEDALNSAKMARTLEGAIEMASQLNVLGGEFAKQDPFQLLFLSRNDPAAYTKKIAEMTKGLATLKKTEDGFEIGISPLDQDRISEAAKALGMTNEELTQTALKFKQIQLAKQDIMGLGLDPKDKEMIANVAKFSSSTGKMFADIGGIEKNIADLTTGDVAMLKQQQKTLADRAKDAVTFDEAFKNTINELKSALLPVLKLINKGIGYMQDLFGGEGTKWVASLSFGAIALGAAFSKGYKVFTAMKALGGFGALGGGGGAGAAGAIGKGGAAAGGLGKAGGALSGSAGGIAALGAAALGAGAGIGLAAVGISKLADSIKELSGTQIWGLAGVVLAIGGAIALTLVPAIIALGSAGTVVAPGLLALGVAAAGIGVAFWGAGQAAKGIGEGFKLASEGVGSLFDKFAAVEPSRLLGLAGGIYAIGGAIATLGAGGAIGLLGGAGALGMILAIASQADSIAKVGDAFKNISVVLNGSADQFERVEKAIANISNAKVGSDSMFSELAKLLSQPLKVEFADKQVAIKSDITLMLDKEKLLSKLNVGAVAAVHHQRMIQGTGASNGTT